MVGGSNPPSATSPLDRLAGAVLRGTDRCGLPPDAHLVIAVSGGPDSMALLHGCARLVATDARRWRLTVAHLDHGLRADSADDAHFTTDVARALDLPVEVRRTDVAALARDESRSLEDAGREARYRLLADLAGDAGWIATGHTADDAAETVLLNLLRGSGLTGARGMPERRDRIIRPLLTERRAALHGWLDEAGIAYRVDPSNTDPAYLRNRVRGELLPALESLRPGSVDALARFARLAADDDGLLDALAGAERIEAVLDAAEGPRGGVSIEVGDGRNVSIRERQIRIERD